MEKSPNKISWAKYSKETMKDLKTVLCFFRLGMPVFLLPNQHNQSIKS